MSVNEKYEQNIAFIRSYIKSEKNVKTINDKWAEMSKTTYQKRQKVAKGVKK